MRTPDEFIFKLTDDAKIEEARKILSGDEQNKAHVMGRIIKRAVPYNPGWSYHLDPNTVGWPGLKGTAFASGIDAVCGVPDNATDLYLFKGDQYLRYKVGDEKIASGPKSLASVWGVDGVFAKGVDDACCVPGGTGDLYFFKGDQYVRVR
ncbi:MULTISPECIES: hypothetical protein [unclassified Kitasatospora]|uniref:BP74-related protein n=1 Tax=unclassified Kitasatospora TaxID=2633591 RepID=UPI0007104336|nr:MULTISPECIES: hypothetical protein [unclassified Kitasatospora]KQV15791.1 hypothetical protein ASC99_29240 [Kitasatospora sp. Root107]KRB65112.1 hypothetical protein ASE03_32555 [Kitasatospora sp. Root187]